MTEELKHEELDAPGIGSFCKHPRCMWPATEHFDSLKTALEHFADSNKVRKMQVEIDLINSILGIEDVSPSVDSYFSYAINSHEYLKDHSLEELKNIIAKTLPE